MTAVGVDFEPSDLQGCAMVWRATTRVRDGKWTHHWAGVEHQNDDLDQRKASLLCLIAPMQLLNVREPSLVPHVGP